MNTTTEQNYYIMITNICWNKYGKHGDNLPDHILYPLTEEAFNKIKTCPKNKLFEDFLDISDFDAAIYDYTASFWKPVEAFEEDYVRTIKEREFYVRAFNLVWETEGMDEEEIKALNLPEEIFEHMSEDDYEWIHNDKTDYNEWFSMERGCGLSSLEVEVWEKI